MVRIGFSFLFIMLIISFIASSASIYAWSDDMWESFGSVTNIISGDLPWKLLDNKWELHFLSVCILAFLLSNLTHIISSQRTIHSTVLVALLVLAQEMQVPSLTVLDVYHHSLRRLIPPPLIFPTHLMTLLPLSLRILILVPGLGVKVYH